MGFQFIHVESWSRSGGRAKKLSVKEIIAEARREPSAALHVKSPRNPVLVYGCGLEELERRHDSLVNAARETLSNGQARALRKDTPSLYTCVLSHPFTPEACRSDPAARAAVEAWARDSVGWLKNDLETKGGRLESVILHLDEAHVHLHAFGLHSSGHADRLHPGKRAKAAAVAKAKASGFDQKTANKMGDRAYVEAMRAWQDDYSGRVGLMHGLTRLGPRKRRLTRAEWNAEQAAAQNLAQARIAAKLAESAAEAAIEKRNRILEEARHQAGEIITNATARLVCAEVAQAEAQRAAKKASAIVQEGERKSEELLSGAKNEVGRFRSVGTLLRKVWDALPMPAFRKQLREEVARVLERETRKVERAEQRYREEIERRKAAEQRLAEALRSTAELGRQRDTARLAQLKMQAKLRKHLLTPSNFGREMAIGDQPPKF